MKKIRNIIKAFVLIGIVVFMFIALHNDDYTNAIFWLLMLDNWVLVTFLDNRKISSR